MPCSIFLLSDLCSAPRSCRNALKIGYLYNTNIRKARARSGIGMRGVKKKQNARRRIVYRCGGVNGGIDQGFRKMKNSGSSANSSKV